MDHPAICRQLPGRPHLVRALWADEGTKRFADAAYFCARHFARLFAPLSMRHSILMSRAFRARLLLTRALKGAFTNEIISHCSLLPDDAALAL